MVTENRNKVKIEATVKKKWLTQTGIAVKIFAKWTVKGMGVIMLSQKTLY